MSSYPSRPAPSPPPPPQRPRRLVVVDAPADDDGASTTSGPRPREPDVAEQPPRQPQPRRGALLAVCGLCGGAGASTLSLLIARYMLNAPGGPQTSNPVLVCDTGGPSGGLAAYAGCESARSLLEVAELVEAKLPAGRVFATTEDGLRVLATGPRVAPTTVCPQTGIATVLEHARGVHPLTVVDCGTLAGQADHIALRAASHVAWTLPATRSASARASRVLEAFNTHLLGRQLLIARRDPAEPKPPMRDLRALAGHVDGPLVLIPHLPHPDHDKPGPVLEAAQVGLEAIRGALQR